MNNRVMHILKNGTVKHIGTCCALCFCSIVVLNILSLSGAIDSCANCCS